MQKEFDRCEDIIKEFYMHILGGHLRRGLLSRRLADKIEQVKKVKLNKQRSFRELKSISDMGDNNKKAIQTSLGKGKSYEDFEVNPNKEKKAIEFLYSHIEFEFTFGFAYLHYLIDSESFDTLKMIETKFKLLSDVECQQQKIVMNGTDKASLKWSQCLVEWKKIINLPDHKKVINWQKILKNSFNSFTQQFLKIILKSILNISTEAELDVSHSQKSLEKISDKLKILITDVFIDNDQITDKKSYGKYKNEIRLGVDNKSKEFVCVNEERDECAVDSKYTYKRSTMMIDNDDANERKEKIWNGKVKDNKTEKYIKTPEKSYDEQSTKRSSKTNVNYNLMKRKTVMTIEFLLKEYESNSVKLSKELDLWKV